MARSCHPFIISHSPFFLNPLQWRNISQYITTVIPSSLVFKPFHFKFSSPLLIHIFAAQIHYTPYLHKSHFRGDWEKGFSEKSLCLIFHLGFCFWCATSYWRMRNFYEMELIAMSVCNAFLLPLVQGSAPGELQKARSQRSIEDSHEKVKFELIFLFKILTWD